MSRIRHLRRPRPATTGTAVAAAALLAATLTPTAGAADRPTRDTAIADAAAVLRDRAASLGLTAAQDTTVRDVIVDADGARHVRYDRTYRELPVLGGDFVVHLTPGGAYRSANRATTREIGLPTVTPAVKAPRAADLAAAALRAANVGETLRKLTSKPRLVVDALHGAPKLAWQTDALAQDEAGNPVARTVVTDATTGKQIDAWDALETATGDGRSLYGGTVPLETTLSGSTYQLKDPTRGNTYTGDAANQTDLCLLGVCVRRAPATLFTDADNHWGTGTGTDRATAAVDAQYGTDTTWDYYKNVHGRNGIAGDGRGSYNRVHYGNSYNNAFWDDSCFCMTYGDGDGTQLGPLVSLDVAGHEMSHGVTSATADLTYSGEPGGLNEATSDIFGTLVEFYADNASDPGDWLVGEKIVRSGPRQAGAQVHGPAEQGRLLGGLLEFLGGEPGRPLLLGGRQPLRVPPRRRQRHEDHRRGRALQHHLRRLDGDRHRQGQAGRDLVPGPDGLHDLVHELRGCAYGDPERGAGSVRVGERGARRGGGGLECGVGHLMRCHSPLLRT